MPEIQKPAKQKNKEYELLILQIFFKRAPAVIEKIIKSLGVSI